MRSGASGSCTSRASTKWGVAAWPGPSSPRRSCSIPTAISLCWSVIAVPPTEIDEVNIHQAGLRAMQRAVLSCAPLPDMVLVDGGRAFRVPDLPMAQRCVVHGDARCTAIAAASIVAKVTRDRTMLELHRQDPRYGFDKHKGYATREHLDAVARHGYSDVHRRSFRPPTLFDRI